MKNVDTTKEREARFGVPFGASARDGRERSAMPRGMKSEKGVVLVVVLVLSAVVLALMTALLYMITSGTQISGLQKRYRTSLEAAKGGSDLFYQVIGSRGDISTLTNVSLSIPPASTCSGQDMSGTTHTGFDAKLSTSSSTWSTGCNSSLTIDPAITTSYDLKLVIGTAPQYNYYVKIVATQEGNSGSTGTSDLYNGSTGTDTGGGVGAIPVVSQPYLYALEVDTENAANPSERAKLSILYQY